MPIQPLQRVRTLGARFFDQFGQHCATHQIRIILVSCVVITSLFYPALDIYYSSTTHLPYLTYLSYFPSLYHPIFGSIPFKPSYVVPASSSSDTSDLQDIWTPHASLRLQEDAVSRARCRRERSVRIERLLIQSSGIPHDDQDGALNRNILTSTLEIENRLATAISQAGINCLRPRPELSVDVSKKENPRCFVVSPLAFWDYDLSSLRSEATIIDTLNTTPNVSIYGILTTPQMVLAGRGSMDNNVDDFAYNYDFGAHFDYAAYVVLTYFFPETDCLGNTEHEYWTKMTKQAIDSMADVDFQASEPTLISLQYVPEHSNIRPNRTNFLISTFTYMTYTFFFAYVTWSMRRMRGVHSRIGLTFTALVEIAVSTVTSLSVCALVGFKITMVPWELLPLIIVFVGAENMFNLVDAVTKTPITLSVRQRIAQGLARAGTSNTLKVVSYNAILGVISVFSFGAIRQFCVFAVVVLVAHWFLAHTFFLAVLSIDLQRLELDELLKQNPNLGPGSSETKREKSVDRRSMNKWQRLIAPVQQALRGRARTNLSLLLLLATTATLYYTTYSSSRWKPPDPSTTVSPRPNALARDRSASQATSSPTESNPAYLIWKTLNPEGSSLLHLRIERPSVVTLRPSINNKSDPGDPAPYKFDGRKPGKGHSVRSRFVFPAFHSIVWLFKIVVLPITATTGALYGLLLYLLKDAELLDAQRNRAEPDAPSDDAVSSQMSLDKWVRFLTLPRVAKADIEAISAGGDLVITSSIQNEVVIWYRSKPELGTEGEGPWMHALLDIRCSLTRSDDGARGSGPRLAPNVTAIAVDSTGRYFALGTSDGVIGVWEWTSASAATPSNHLQIACIEIPQTDMGPSTVDLAFSLSASRPTLLCSYSDRQVIEWTASSTHSFRRIDSTSNSVCAPVLVRAQPDGRPLVAFCMEDGRLEIVEIGSAFLLHSSPFIVQAGSPGDVVAVIDACYMELNGSSRLIIAAATAAGTISLWDGSSGESIYVFDDSFGCISALRISPITSERCQTCGELPPESFSVTFSRGSIVQFFKAFLPTSATRRCVCARQQLRQGSSWESINVGRRSRSGSLSSGYVSGGAKANGSASNGGSPLISRPRLATAFEVSPFPVSGHGVHSRKASDKDSSRRLSDILAVPPLAMEDFDPVAFHSNADVSANPSPAVTGWQGVVVVRSFADITCERGCWDVLDGKVVGIRRRPRLGTANGTTGPRASASSSGLSPATLERWELWVWDPQLSQLLCSSLALLTNEPSHEKPRYEDVARLPFTRVSPLICSRSYGLAGFGNTFGIIDFSSQYS